jgi:zinc transporter ZupT
MAMVDTTPTVRRSHSGLLGRMECRLHAQKNVDPMLGEQPVVDSTPTVRPSHSGLLGRMECRLHAHKNADPFCIDLQQPLHMPTETPQQELQPTRTMVEPAADTLSGQLAEPTANFSSGDVQPFEPNEVCTTGALTCVHEGPNKQKNIWLLAVGAPVVLACIQCMNLLDADSFRVCAFGWLTCITTGFGVAPFLFINADDVNEQTLALANTIAGGMMLAASTSMLEHSHEHSGVYDWQLLVGLLAGALFIMCSQRILGDDEEAGIEGLHGAIMERRHFNKAVLIFTVMFCHSAAEGVAVGVCFDSQLNTQFGLFISILLAVHNMPEGLAMALVLVPRGVSIKWASVIATLTSVPQPIVAVIAFWFVDAFKSLLPVGLAFAAGAMIYVSLHELLSEAKETLGLSKAVAVTGLSFGVMYAVSYALHNVAGL